MFLLVKASLLGLLCCCSACTSSNSTPATLPPLSPTAAVQQPTLSNSTATPEDISSTPFNEQPSAPAETALSELPTENSITNSEIPATETTEVSDQENASQLPAFDRFVDQVKTGDPNQLVGVYIENVLALRVVQQPPDDANYVSNVNGVATQFMLPYQISGNIGLLAHNYLSGSLFFDIKVGDIAQLVFGDGNVDEYVVSEYHEYQALSPNSPNSDFIDLTTGEKLSAGELFNRIYSGSHRLVFQTCIAQDDIDTWGRLFVISFPY